MKLLREIIVQMDKGNPSLFGYSIVIYKFSLIVICIQVIVNSLVRSEVEANGNLFQ